MSTRAPRRDRARQAGRRKEATAAPVHRRPAGLSPRLLALAAGLAAAALTLYARVRGFPFIANYDDSLYVTENTHVTSGLKPENIAWAFTHPVAGNWHPLTVLTHMADVTLFGLDPGRHHLVNAVLHAIDAALVLIVFVACTGRLWPSAFVAALFAVHPLHVESVAWIAERKDVLSTLFWLLTMLAYVRWTRSGRALDLGSALGAYALGLMSKPMLVTLPFVLLLMDAWPLRRLDPARATKSARPVSWMQAVVEKWPFALLSVASIALTLWAQVASGAAAGTVILPLGTRIENAFLAYVRYLGKLFVPTRLAFLYPYAVHIPVGQAVAAVLALAGITVAVLVARKRAPYLAFGWFWYLGTLVPVIGIVQAGSQSMADRYTYVPHLGIYVAITWGIVALAERLRVPRLALAAAALAVLVACVAVTSRQLGYWSSAERLFRHGLDVTDGNFIAENNYAVELMNKGDVQGAQRHFARAVEFNPSYGNALCNLGITETRLGKLDSAYVALTRARAVEPRDPKVLLNLGFLLLIQKRYEPAIGPFQDALRLQPENPEAHEMLANAENGYGAELIQKGRTAEALQAFEQALAADPANATARKNAEIARGVLTNR